MNARTRVLVILASAVGASVLVLALSTESWQGAPVTPPAVAAAASPLVRQNPVAEVAPITLTGEAAVAAAVSERTEVAVSPSGRNAVLGNEERVRLRAAELGKKLALSAAAEETLTAVLLEEQTRRASAVAELRRKPDDAEVRARVRTELDAILAWKTQALNDQFGAQHAAEIMKRR